MANAAIKVTNREEGKNPRQIRSAGFLPGSIYGKGIEPKNIQIDTHEFELMYKKNKEAVWELTLDKEKMNAKIQELQVNYATNEYLNVEFQIV